MTIGDLKKILEGVCPTDDVRLFLEGVCPTDSIQLFIEDEYGCPHSVDAAYLISIVTDPRDLKGPHFRAERKEGC